MGEFAVHFWVQVYKKWTAFAVAPHFEFIFMKY